MSEITARPFRLALIQLGGTGPNKTHNLSLARTKVLQAANTSPKPDLIVLPEIFNSPYAVTKFAEYAERVLDVGEQGQMEESSGVLSRLAKEAGVWLIGGSIPEREESTGNIYNTCTVWNPDGDMVAKHRKVHLFDIDIPGRQTFKESDSLTAGQTLNSFETPFGKIGLGICYDIRFPEMAMIAARQGCVAMIYPAAFNTTTGPMHWTLLQKGRAIDNQMFVAMCSPARNMDSSYHAYGHSSVVNPLGEVLAEADENETIVYADIDTEVLATTRRNLPVTVQRRFDVYADVAETA